jgi:hypothetical protein
MPLTALQVTNARAATRTSSSKEPHMRLFLHSVRLIPLLFAVLSLAGCPEAQPVTPPVDAGGNISDAGANTPDAAVVVQRLQPSNAVTAGGGKGENGDYKVRLLIGGPTAVGTGQNNTNQVKIGAGAAQHGQ